MVQVKEVILNIYLVVNNNEVTEFRAVAYEKEGSDDYKIRFLKGRASKDYGLAYRFDAPYNKDGNYMKYKKFARLEERGRQFELFEEIFSKFQVPQNPLICVTPVQDGKILAEEAEEIT
jgi:hypothetical protein